jgi:seryl-tRNA(Sec) selenium transferase
MPTDDDRAYFERRAQQERARAENASNPIAYKLHAEMAQRYEQRLRSEAWGSTAVARQSSYASPTA